MTETNVQQNGEQAGRAVLAGLVVGELAVVGVAVIIDVNTEHITAPLVLGEAGAIVALGLLAISIYNHLTRNDQ